MKTNLRFAGVAIMVTLTTLLFNSCKKNNADTTVTDTEAASIVSSETSSGAGGVTYDITQAISYPLSNGNKTKGISSIETLPCNTLQSDPISWTSNSGGYYFNYNGYSNYELNCTGGNPTSYTVNDGYNGQYNLGTSFSGSTNDTSSWVITGLGTSTYIVNGSFNINGSYKTTSGSKTVSFSFNMTYNVSSVTVDKTSQQITGGTASVSETVSGNGGATYTFNGNIVFNNNNTATITVGSYSATVAD